MRLLRGPADRQRPPRLPPRARARLQGHLPALQDDAGPLRRSARAAGTATACRSRSRSSSSSASRASTTSRATASPSSTRSAASRCFEFLEDWKALTERIGFWVDLDDAYRTMDTDVRRVRLVGARAAVGARTCSTRATRSSRTARAAAPRCRATRSRWATRTSRTRASTCSSRSRAGAARCATGDQLLIWTTTPVDARLQRRRRGRPRADLRARRRGRRGLRAGRGARRARARRGRRRSHDRFPGARARSARGYEPPFPLHRAPRSTAPKGHTVLPGDFVTADDGTGIVHTAIAFGEDDFRLGAEHGLDVVNPVAARRHLRRAHRPVRGPLGQGRRPRPDRGPARARPAAARRDAPARLPALLALRHAAALLRQAVLVHPHDARCATSCSPPTRRSPGTRRTSSTGASASGSRTTSTGRSRASATGARRCRSGAAQHGHAVAHRLARRARGALRHARSTTRTARTSTTSHLAVRRTAAATMRRVPEVIDVWFDSGRDAVRAVARAVRERRSASSSDFPADFICEALDQTRGWFYSLLAVSTLLFDQAPYRNVVCLGLHPRRQGREDVQVQGQHRRALGRPRPPTAPTRFRWYFFTSKQPVGRLPVLRRRGRRVAAPVPAAALEHLRLLRPVRQRRAATTTRAPSRRRTLDRWAISAAWTRRSADGHARRMERYDATTAPAARIAAFVDELSNWYVRRSRRRFWDGDPAAFATLHTCLVDGRAAARAVLPVRRRRALRQPRRHASRASTSPTSRQAGRARRGARVRGWRVVRATVEMGRARARAGEAQGPPAAGGGRRRRRRRRARGDRVASPTSVREELNVKELRFVDRGRRARLLRGQAQLPHARPALRQAHAAGRRPRSAALDPAHVAAALRDGAHGRHQRRRPRPRARPGRPPARDAAARGLPGRARRLARRRARARARRRPAPRGPRARDRPRRPERPQGARASTSPTASRSRSTATTELLAAAREHEAYDRRRGAGDQLSTSAAAAGAAAIDGRELEGRPRISVQRA